MILVVFFPELDLKSSLTRTLTSCQTLPFPIGQDPFRDLGEKVKSRGWVEVAGERSKCGVKSSVVKNCIPTVIRFMTRVDVI